MNDSFADQDESRRYLAQVESELARRRERVGALIGDIEQLHLQLSRSSYGRALIRGDVRELQHAVGHRRSLEGRLKQKQLELDEARVEVARALERLEMVMAEIEHSGEGEQ